MKKAIKFAGVNRNLLELKKNEVPGPGQYYPEMPQKHSSGLEFSKALARDLIETITTPKTSNILRKSHSS